RESKGGVGSRKLRSGAQEDVAAIHHCACDLTGVRQLKLLQAEGCVEHTALPGNQEGEEHHRRCEHSHERNSACQRSSCRSAKATAWKNSTPSTEATTMAAHSL